MPDDPGYWALRREVGAVWLARDFVTVRGPDALGFLQGQLSQDLTKLSVGDASWSWLLQPSGKVEALVRVSRIGDDQLVIDTDAGWGDAVATRLNRFKLRTKADIEQPQDWRCLTVRGPAVAPDLVCGDAVVHHRFDWPGLPGVDALGPADAVVVPDGVTVAHDDAWEAVRVEAGIPRMGAELTDSVIPGEVGLWLVERTVSFTKGCYTGQELVARIHSRGDHVPHHLVGVVVATNVLPPVGASLRGTDGKDVGSLTSVAESRERRAPIGLGYVHRSVDTPAEVIVVWDGGEVVARVEALPLVQ